MTAVYLIAELGSVHDGSLGNALRLIEEVAAAGADAAKMQDHRGERIKGMPPWVRESHETRDQYLKRTSFDDEAWRLLKARAKAVGVEFVVSPFSVEAVELQERTGGVDAYKVASGQVTNLPMLEAIAKTGRPFYLSSGMTTSAERAAALAVMMRIEGVGPGLILQCTSEYPCPPDRVGLHGIGRGFGGLSDHTMGFAASLAAITLGATVIERHVCFDRRGYGTDCRHSLTLDEFARFVREVRDLEKMLASPVDKDALVKSEAMQEMRKAFLE